MPTGYIPRGDYAAQHNGFEHLAIDNTFWRRTLTLLSLKTTARLYPQPHPCRIISNSLIVKPGFTVHLTEVATMQYVAANTSIPVPRVYWSFVHENYAYIVMERRACLRTTAGSSLPSSGP